MLTNLWRFRYFIIASIQGELKARVARSYFGTAWFILQPMAQALIFALVLSEVLAARLPQIDNKAAYAVYVLSGMAAWGLFSEIVNRCLTIFIDYSPSLKKISFPRLCLPLIVLGSALINHAMVLAVSMALFCLLGICPGWTVLWLPLGIVLVAAFALGIGVILGTLNVFARDVGQITSIALQIGFWLTPIAYPPGTLPAQFAWISTANPLTPLVAVYHKALLSFDSPASGSLSLTILLSAALLLIAGTLFRRASPDLVDAL